MKHLAYSALLGVAIWLICANSLAMHPERHKVGLGVTAGAALPHGSSGDKIAFDEWDPAFAWGFYVDIPLIKTFHITPTTELYQFGDVNATDVSLAFKFIIPAWRLDFFFGLVPGVTTVGKTIGPHVGALAGIGFNLVSNLDLFIQCRYSWVFTSDGSPRILNPTGGLRFHF